MVLTCHVSPIDIRVLLYLIYDQGLEEIWDKICPTDKKIAAWGKQIIAFVGKVHFIKE